MRGVKQSAEWSSNKSVGLKKAWDDPEKFKTMRHQSPEIVERRVAPLRGRTVPPDIRAKISAANIGKTLSPEHREKAIKQLRRYADLTPEQREKRNLKISIQRTGKHNFGRAARDRRDHFNAKHWVIQCPVGRIYEFDNLQSWARKHEHIFEPDQAPESRMALWRRAVSGFNNMRRTDGKATHHWRGWIIIKEPVPVETDYVPPEQLQNRKFLRILAMQAVCASLTKLSPTSSAP